MPMSPWGLSSSVARRFLSLWLFFRLALETLPALDYWGFTMIPSYVLTLFLLSLFQHSAHSSPLQPRSANGPVITTNFMDPSVIELNNGYYAFAGANGNPAGINVQVAYSPDFSSWAVNSGYDALPALGAWAANPGHVWAPDINELVCYPPIAQASIRPGTAFSRDWLRAPC
jgi:hypothetical protein